MSLHNTTEPHPYVKDLSGQRFGRLLVTSYAGRKNTSTFWNCLCDCGNSCQIDGCSLKRGFTRSCGCLAKETRIILKTTHGFAKHPLWNTYILMIKRCYNPKNPSYGSYGGRSITVCDRWRESFENFLADMGERPAGCSLDRIDNDGPYSPDNCRWATTLQQNNNKRRNHRLTHDGETLTITEWANRLGISRKAILSRLRYEWSTERILTEPVKSHLPYKPRKK